MGFDSYDYANERVIEKAGALAGVRTIISMLPSQDSGIVVLSNMNVATFPEAVRAYYLNQQLGIDPETFQPELLAKNAELAKMFAEVPKPANDGPFWGNLESLVGTYEDDYYGQCAILLKDEALSVECGPAKYAATLKHWSNGAFAMLFPGATQAPSLTTFTIGQDGTADSFTGEALGVFTRVKEKE